MRRTVLPLALALLLGGCGAATTGGPVPLPEAATPQRAELGWREAYPGRSGERLVFVVEELAVTADGWTARVAVSNRTSVAFDSGRPVDFRYGLMLFATGDLGELEEAARSGGLPSVRQASSIEPPPPAVLRPGATWRATLSAAGSLPAGAYARVVFGPLSTAGDPPEGVEPVVVWITDNAHRL